MIVILMGVSGSGKTSVGSALAHRLGWRFLDADDFHPPANVERMSRGIALTDADRAPWLTILNTELRQAAAAEASVVLACSALRARYRAQLAAGLDPAALRWVHLDATPALIRSRMQARQDHFMPAALLESQFETLEPPADALVVDAALPIAQVVEVIVEQLVS